MAILKENVLVLSTGKKIRVQVGNLGINCFLEISQGFANPLLRFDPDSSRDPDVDAVCNVTALSQDEAIELADYGASLWLRLKENIVTYGITSPAIFAR